MSRGNFTIYPIDKILLESYAPESYNIITSPQEMSVYPDPRNPTPLYHQLKELVRQQIEQGELRPGEMLPTEKSFEQKFGLSRITVRQALGKLAQEGYITRTRGKGSFVARATLQDKRLDRLGAFLEDLEHEGHSVRCMLQGIERIASDHKLASLLRVPEGTTLIRVPRLALVDEEPTCLSTAFWAERYAPRVLEKELESYISFYPYFEKHHRLFLEYADKTLQAVSATQEEAVILKIKAGAPVLLSEILSFTAQHEPRLLIKSVYRGDRYSYYVRLHRHRDALHA